MLQLTCTTLCTLEAFRHGVVDSCECAISTWKTDRCLVRPFTVFCLVGTCNKNHLAEIWQEDKCAVLGRLGVTGSSEKSWGWQGRTFPLTSTESDGGRKETVRISTKEREFGCSCRTESLREQDSGMPLRQRSLLMYLFYSNVPAWHLMQQWVSLGCRYCPSWQCTCLFSLLKGWKGSLLSKAIRRACTVYGTGAISTDSSINIQTNVKITCKYRGRGWGRERKKKNRVRKPHIPWQAAQLTLAFMIQDYCKSAFNWLDQFRYQDLQLTKVQEREII